MVISVSFLNDCIMEPVAPKPFFVRIFKDPPVLFPLVMLFHLFLLLYAAAQFIGQGVLWTEAGIIDTAWHLVYFSCWLFVCDMRKWAATGYMIFTAINLLLQFALKHQPVWHDAGITLFPIDVLMTAFLIFYYKRFH